MAVSTASREPSTLAAPVRTRARTALRPLAPGDAHISGGFWRTRQDRNRVDALAAGYEQLETSGTLDNFRIAAGTSTGHARGMIFQDSDVYKWLEAVAYEIGRAEDPVLRSRQQEVTALVAAAQQSDGYLNSVHQLRHGPEERYTDLAWNHELYCYGHLFQAAVAQARSTGETTLLDVSLRVLDHLVAVFGPGHHEGVPGHPEIEMALVELYRETGRNDALELARFFLDRRGHGYLSGLGHEPTYFSDRVPVREASTVEGHAVRALYLAAGATDLAIEDADTELLAHLRSVFATMLATKTYVTGGMGSRWAGEAYGDPYELSTDHGYAETCAGIAAVQWAWRLLLASGDEQYADLIERALFNAVLPGVSLGGTEFFYVNPLQLRSNAQVTGGTSAANGRRGWFQCACCPPNVMRTLSSLDQYVATSTDDGLQIHQFANGTYTAEVGSERLSVEITTDYPHDGRITLRVVEAPEVAASLSVRIPAWAGSALLDAGDGAQEVAGSGVQELDRRFRAGEEIVLDIDMTPRFVTAPHRVDASRGAVALERGPLVYAIEQADQEGPAVVDDALVDPSAPVVERPIDDLDGVVAVDLTGAAAAAPSAAAIDRSWPYSTWTPDPAPVTDHVWRAIPYFAWANRGAGPMRVWLPEISGSR